MSWKIAAGVTLGLFGAGVAVGIAAQKRGIPQDKVPRWLVKESLRRALRVSDLIQDALPGDPPKALAGALTEAGPEAPT